MQQDTDKATTLHGVSLAQVDTLQKFCSKPKPSDGRELTLEEYHASFEEPEWLQLMRRTVTS